MDIFEKDRTERFITLFERAKRTYEEEARRLAADGWDEPWQTLVATILSAQNRDEVTIPAAAELFKKYDSVEKLAEARIDEVEDILDSVNYYKSKSQYIVETAQRLVDEYEGTVPDSLDELLSLPGVGRKTANLVITEVHDKPGICVDTHVHRIANVFGLVDTDRTDATEQELREVAPQEYWKEINRYFVLWGQDVPGEDPERLLDRLE